MISANKAYSSNRPELRSVGTNSSWLIMISWKIVSTVLSILSYHVSRGPVVDAHAHAHAQETCLRCLTGQACRAIIFAPGDIPDIWQGFEDCCDLLHQKVPEFCELCQTCRGCSHLCTFLFALSLLDFSAQESAMVSVSTNWYKHFDWGVGSRISQLPTHCRTNHGWNEVYLDTGKKTTT